MQPRLTVLLPRLSGWIPQLSPQARYPALETLLARADRSPALAGDLDILRLRLFGVRDAVEAPVAALGCLAAGRLAPEASTYCLRMDPIALQADLNRVVLMRTGFGGFPADYQQQVRKVIEQTLATEESTAPEFELEADDIGWILRLQQDPDATFVSLDAALGADISDCLPEGSAARFWKRLQNEIQMALHASSANQSRRQAGQPLINSVWFWGGGKLPKMPATRSFDLVCAADPVSSGLARLSGSGHQALREVVVAAGEFLGELPAHTLVDWAVPFTHAEDVAWHCTPERLEGFCAAALQRLQRRGGCLEIHSPEISWHLQTKQLWRIWRGPKPLAANLQEQLQVQAGEL